MIIKIRRMGDPACWDKKGETPTKIWTDGYLPSRPVPGSALSVTEDDKQDSPTVLETPKVTEVVTDLTTANTFQIITEEGIFEMEVVTL